MIRKRPSLIHRQALQVVVVEVKERKGIDHPPLPLLHPLDQVVRVPQVHLHNPLSPKSCNDNQAMTKIEKKKGVLARDQTHLSARIEIKIADHNRLKTAGISLAKGVNLTHHPKTTNREGEETGNPEDSVAVLQKTEHTIEHLNADLPILLHTNHAMPHFH